jgi:hypothetical protein
MIATSLIVLAAFIVLAVLWVLLKMARWSAPVSAAVGFLIAWGSNPRAGTLPFTRGRAQSTFLPRESATRFA